MKKLLDQTHNRAIESGSDVKRSKFILNNSFIMTNSQFKIDNDGDRKRKPPEDSLCQATVPPVGNDVSTSHGEKNRFSVSLNWTNGAYSLKG